jgi:hypothetical protein
VSSVALSYSPEGRTRAGEHGFWVFSQRFACYSVQRAESRP